jgi:cell shape-determining protein MreC
MSLTLLYRGKNVSFKMKFSKAQWLPVAVVAVAGSIWAFNGAMKNTSETEHVRQQLNQAQQEYAQSKEKLSLLKQQTEHRLSALTLKLGEMKGQINRLDAFTTRVAE